MRGADEKNREGQVRQTHIGNYSGQMLSLSSSDYYAEANSAA
jgi:hypothetical protein